MEDKGIVTAISELGKIIDDLRFKVESRDWKIRGLTSELDQEKEKTAEMEKSKAKWEDVAEQLTEKIRKLKGEAQ